MLTRRYEPELMNLGLGKKISSVTRRQTEYKHVLRMRKILHEVMMHPILTTTAIKIGKIAPSLINLVFNSTRKMK